MAGVETADVVVIGAGVNGASTAYHLAAKGVKDVLVVDRAGIASGPTGVSTALVRQHHGHAVTAQMARDSLRFFQQFDELTGGHAEFRTCGAIIAGPEESLSTIRDVVERQQQLGVRTAMISRDDVRGLEPDMLVDDLGGAAWEPDAGYADPVGTCAGLIAGAVARGARCWLNTTVTGLLAEAGRLVGVETSRGKVLCEKAVLAAGPWCVPLALTVGTDLPIKSSSHPVVVFEHASGKRPTHIVFDIRQIIYLRPEGSKLTLVGALDGDQSPEEADPDRFQTRPSFDVVSDWSIRLLNRFPGYGDVRVRRGWCGIYEHSPDWHHIIDELPSANGCWVICGTSGHGFKLGPAVGDVVSDALLGREPAYNMNDFRLDRFEQGAEIANTYPNLKRPF